MGPGREERERTRAESGCSPRQRYAAPMESTDERGGPLPDDSDLAASAAAVRVALVGEPGFDARARRLADELQLRLHLVDEHFDRGLLLWPGPEGIEIREGAAPRRSGARVDFTARSIGSGARNPGHARRGQPLFRAIGRRSRRVVDATAGFGDDAIAIASSGREVLAIERSPVMARLLLDAGERAARAAGELRATAARLTVCCGDAREVLRVLPSAPDVVYVDPMYPLQRSRSALPRKQIQLLRRLVGDDPDAADTVACALASGARRVVVKRPLRAEPLAGKPTEQFQGKLARYDVYLDHRA